MTGPAVRRVVTGHDGDGSSVIASDEVLRGPRFTLIWSTDTSPANNMDEADGGRREVGLTLDGGTVFRVGQLDPGDRSPMHRTNSVDYGIVLEGEVGMELDGGEQVRLRVGDVIVQRGTNHLWFNDGKRPCRIAWILIDAEPARVGSQVLEPTPFPPPRADEGG
jgi:quercetin dioxygenase-like cupin family protein